MLRSPMIFVADKVRSIVGRMEIRFLTQKEMEPHQCVPKREIRI